MRIMVTGGAGFIGSAVVRHIVKDTLHSVINVDKLTYAGNLHSLASCSNSDRYCFEQVDICNSKLLATVFIKYQPDIVMHLAAESHVDRSIDGASAFIQTNIVGTFTLLEVSRKYWNNLEASRKQHFKFHHISTDEVFGDLGDSKGSFIETTSYDPSSPYAASKASSDHLVRAWCRTYGLPTVITNCSNNYGPFHFPEKLIPLMILNALEGKDLPVYGDGQQIRDWLYVEDHARALIKVVEKGRIGETYNIGGHNEKANIDVVKTICKLLEELVPTCRHSRVGGNPTGFEGLIKYVKDRPGHDVRYAIDASKIERELGWTPRETFKTGLRKTVSWYLENEFWWRDILDGSYNRERLGIGEVE